MPASPSSSRAEACHDGGAVDWESCATQDPCDEHAPHRRPPPSDDAGRSACRRAARTNGSISSIAASASSGPTSRQQLNGGQVVSVFGNVYEGIDIDPSPGVTADRARGVVEARAGHGVGRAPELVILPREAGGYVLA